MAATNLSVLLSYGTPVIILKGEEGERAGTIVGTGTVTRDVYKAGEMLPVTTMVYLVTIDPIFLEGRTGAVSILVVDPASVTEA